MDVASGAAILRASIRPFFDIRPFFAFPPWIAFMYKCTAQNEGNLLPLLANIYMNCFLRAWRRRAKGEQY